MRRSHLPTSFAPQDSTEPAKPRRAKPPPRSLAVPTLAFCALAVSGLAYTAHLMHELRRRPGYHEAPVTNERGHFLRALAERARNTRGVRTVRFGVDVLTLLELHGASGAGRVGLAAALRREGVPTRGAMLALLARSMGGGCPDEPDV